MADDDAIAKKKSRKKNNKGKRKANQVSECHQPNKQSHQIEAAERVGSTSTTRGSTSGAKTPPTKKQKNTKANESDGLQHQQRPAQNKGQTDAQLEKQLTKQERKELKRAIRLAQRQSRKKGSKKKKDNTSIGEAGSIGHGNGNPPQARTESQKNSSKHTPKTAVPPPDNDDDSSSDHFEDENGNYGVQNDFVVEGVFVDGKIYLVDKKLQVVYAGERDESGGLVRVGTWDPVKQKPIPDALQLGTAPAWYPFEVDDADHCESPADAYKHIAPALRELCERLGKTPETCQIYDPYFCAGSVIANLGVCGFTNVYNKCEDFYQVQRENRVPAFDIVVTNPPYSGDHVERVLQFCLRSGRPWFLLLPNFFIAKPWYTQHTNEAGEKPFYLVPRKRYLYRTPKGGRSKDDMRKDRKTSPFTTFWYCGVGGALREKRALIIKKAGRTSDPVIVAPRREAIPSVVLDPNDPMRRGPSGGKHSNPKRGKFGKGKNQ